MRPYWNGCFTYHWYSADSLLPWFSLKKELSSFPPPLFSLILLLCADSDTENRVLIPEVPSRDNKIGGEE